MKIKLDVGRLRQIMRKRGIHTYKELAEQSGVSLYALWIEKNRTETLSKENLWLIADCLECTINDIVYPDWSDEV